MRSNENFSAASTSLRVSERVLDIVDCVNPLDRRDNSAVADPLCDLRVNPDDFGARPTFEKATEKKSPELDPAKDEFGHRYSPLGGAPT